MKKATSSPTLPRPELVLLVALALLALALSALMTAEMSGAAGPLYQDSPVSPTGSPLPTPNDTPTPTTPVPQAEEPAAAMRPPIPVPMLAGIMVLIGLVALAVGMRRA